MKRHFTWARWIAGVVLAGLLLPCAGAEAEEVVTRVVLTPERWQLDRSRVLLSGFERDLTPGLPGLPMRRVRVALHPRADLATLRVRPRSGPTDTVQGSFRLEPNPPATLVVEGGHALPVWGTREPRLRGGRDPEAFGPAVFPARAVREDGVENRREMKVLRLVFQPLRYRHATGELLLERHSEVELRYRLRPGPDPAPDPVLAEHVGELHNAAEARNWYAWRTDSGPKLGYAIVIRDSLARASKQLAAFVQHKRNLGLDVTVVGDSDLKAISIGAKDGDAERIRGWLKQSYKTKNLKYVLLIGNPDTRRDGVPMKLTYAMADHYRYKIYTPTDHYYADLTGNWDVDGDGLAAEYTDDGGTTGVDFTPELYVGRIPIYDDNATALDRILVKTAAYETEKGDRAWRRRVLQPAAMLFYAKQYGDSGQLRVDGADMAETIYSEVIAPRGLTRTTLYEAEGVDISRKACDLPLTPANLISTWQKGYGLVTWFGHGSATGVYRTVWTKDNGNQIPDWYEVSSPAFFTYDDVLELDDARPSVVFHGSCSNGTPERADNIGYGLLLHGAIATASASREAIVVFGGTGSDANIFGLERDFTRFLLEKKTTGQAIFEAKQLVSDSLERLSWLTRLQLNLYGDPSVAMLGCATDADCSNGLRCDGVERCVAGQCAPGSKVVCTSADPCTESRCEEATASCKPVPRPDNEPCDDGRFCTTNDICLKGRCVGWSRCDVEDNPCVAVSCDEVARTCDVAAASKESQVCREDTTREGICTRGICEPQAASGCTVGGGGSGAFALLGLLWGLSVCRRRRARKLRNGAKS